MCIMILNHGQIINGLSVNYSTYTNIGLFNCIYVLPFVEMDYIQTKKKKKKSTCRNKIYTFLWTQFIAIRIYHETH